MNWHGIETQDSNGVSIGRRFCSGRGAECAWGNAFYDWTFRPPKHKQVWRAISRGHMTVSTILKKWQFQLPTKKSLFSTLFKFSLSCLWAWNPIRSREGCMALHGGDTSDIPNYFVLLLFKVLTFSSFFLKDGLDMVGRPALVNLGNLHWSPLMGAGFWGKSISCPPARTWNCQWKKWTLHTSAH